MNIENMFGGGAALLRRRMMLSGQEEIKEMGYRLINSVTIDEESHYISITTDENGNPFELDDFVVVIVGTSNSESNGAAVHVNLNDNGFGNAVSIPKLGTDTTYHGGICWNDGMVVQADTATGAFGAISPGNASKTYIKKYLLEKVRSVKLNPASAAIDFGAGTTVALYGR